MSGLALPDWVVLHVPHDSSFIPDEERKHMLPSDADLHHELLAMTDHWTFDLFASDLPPEQVVRAECSRLVVDVERFEDDHQEPMAARGMGVIYQRTSDGRRLREAPTKAERERLLRQYYYPHHQRLTEAVDRALSRCGKALIVDAHSFSSHPLQHESDQRPNRPDVCIGTDLWHTPHHLAKSLAEAFRKSGWSVAIDAPFSGSMVPLAHYRKRKDVSSVMIEVNKKQYMNETTGQRNDGFAAAKRVLWNSLCAAFGPRR